MKTLKELFEIYRPKAKGEQDFVDKHVVIKHKDRNGNDDDVFNGKTKPVNRKKNRQGYDAGDDEKVYEETEELDELSKSKVGNYMKKAEPIYDKAHSEVVNDTGGNFDKSFGTMLKRSAGWDNAKAKLSGKAKVPATNEEVDLDEEKEVHITKRNKHDISHYRVLNNGKDVSRHDDYDEAKQYAAKHRAYLRKNGYKNEVTVHAYVKEDIDLDEAVSVSHHRYLRSHGKKASGSGAWIFTHKMNGKIDLNDDKSSHIGKGKFSDAAKSAKAWAKKHGHTTVYVAEEHADEMLRNAILEMAELEGEDLTEENLDTLVEAMLDELSRKTLSNYVRKASPKVASHSASQMTSNDIANMEYHGNKVIKRLKGINTAASKLAKEEAELDEGSLGTWSHEKLKSFANVPHGSYSPKEISNEIQRRKRNGEYNANYQTEGVEELEELRGSTVKSYIKKSIDDKDFHDKQNPTRVWDSETRKFKPRDQSNNKEVYHTRELNKRNAGLKRAYNKMAEESEDLDELSKGTLSSYVIKATHPSLENSISNLASKGGFKNASTLAGSDDDKDPNKNGEKEDSKAAKRSYGVIRAVSKLTKEDVINRAIEKYVVSEAELPTPADRLLSKLDGLSETHVNTLLTMFNSLNEDNQMKMLYTAETQEGILSLLDFSIQNKGV